MLVGVALLQTIGWVYVSSMSVASWDLGLLIWDVIFEDVGHDYIDKPNHTYTSKVWSDMLHYIKSHPMVKANHKVKPKVSDEKCTHIVYTAQ